MSPFAAFCIWGPRCLSYPLEKAKKETAENKGGRFVLALVVLAAFTSAVAINALANAISLSGVNTGTLSGEIPNLFMPLGLTFSIWGIIYVLLAVLAATVLFQAFSAKTISSTWTDLPPQWLYIGYTMVNFFGG
jgi:hypothetical protein